METKVGRAFRYQFELTLHQLDAEIPFPCSIEFQWARNNVEVSTASKTSVKGSEKAIPINAKLALACTCFLKQSLDFVEKRSIISIILNINGEPKNGGHIFLNLSSILSPLDHKTGTTKQFHKLLEKSVLKNARLRFSLKSSYVKQMLEQDLKQQSTSIASSNQKSMKSLNSLNSFNFKDFGDLLEGEGNKSIHSLRAHKESRSICSERRRCKGNSEMSDDYDLSQKQKQGVFRLQAENTQLRLFAEEHEKRINELVQEMEGMRGEYQERVKGMQEMKVKEVKMMEESQGLRNELQNNKREHHQELSQLRRQNSQLQSIITKQELSFQHLQSSSQTTKLHQKSIANQLLNKQLLIKQLQTKIEKSNLESTNVQRQMQEILKSNLELKVEITMLQQRNNSVIDNRINELKRKVVSSEDALKECEEIVSVLKKEVKEKNVVVAVQEEKIRILDQAIAEREWEVEELKRAGVMRESLLEEGQNRAKGLEGKIKSLKESIRKYQEFIKTKEDESRASAKQAQQFRINITHLNRIIQQNNLTLSLRSQQLLTHQHHIHQLTSSLHHLQTLNPTLQQQLSQTLTQNKSLIKTNQLLLQQLAKCKQQTLNQSTESQNKWLQRIDVLENQIKRRDVKIGKMESENRQLEEDNIRLNIKIMKELNELQKRHFGGRGGGGGGGGSSGQNSGMFESKQLK